MLRSNIPLSEQSTFIKTIKNESLSNFFMLNNEPITDSDFCVRSSASEIAINLQQVPFIVATPKKSSQCVSRFRLFYFLTSTSRTTVKRKSYIRFDTPRDRFRRNFEVGDDDYDGDSHRYCREKFLSIKMSIADSF